MIYLKEFNEDDEIVIEKTFDTIDECIDFLYLESYIEDFDLDEDEIIDNLNNNNNFRFGGGYSNINLNIL